jgi:caffeoyl-CoA O-methyltransferase
MDLSHELEQYIALHSDAEDELLAELYRQTHLRFVNPRMASGHIQGKFLEFISKMLKPKYILEIGTYTGYSAICLAKGLQAGGELHTIEINDELEEFAASYIQRSGMQKQIIQHIGSALEIVPKLDLVFDLVFIDGEKAEYVQYYQAALDKTVSGGFILADNVLWDGKILTPAASGDWFTKGLQQFNEFVKNDKRVEKMILPLRDGMMLLRKK